MTHANHDDMTDENGDVVCSSVSVPDGSNAESIPERAEEKGVFVCVCIPTAPS